MICLGVHYLNGWAMATHPADRTRPEWPPHPDRMFMALAAAHFETGAAPAEAAVLMRLEAEPPVLHVARHEDRSPVTSYVPVNDTPAPVRQARQFPVAIPEDPVVHLVWSDLDLAPEEARTLAELCGKVTRVGHSASLVQVWVEDAMPDLDGIGRVELLPVGHRTARYRLRVPGEGRLDRLRSDFAAGQRPRASLWCGYQEAGPSAVEPEEGGTCFDSGLLVLRKNDGPALGLESTLQVTNCLRKTVLSHCPDPPPEWVTGHRSDRTPSEEDHLAFLPLPHVGREHADGHLLGLALAVPKDVPRDERQRCLGPLFFDQRGHSRQLTLKMGRLGRWTLELEERDYRPVSLRSETWTAGPPSEASRRWATVTPIALDRHPKGPDRWGEMEHSIRRSCGRIGLAEPEDVVISPVSLFPGAPTGWGYPNLRRGKGGGKVQHTHAIVTFGEPVRGPVLLGAGRYRGYGLCRPLTDEEVTP